jgi:NADH-quinone oxidoreductase subunit L
MGGLRHRMPLTFWTYVFGTLALAGVIPFAGFWSKDEILADALNVGLDDGRLDGYIAFAVLLIAAGFTAFYMWRQVSMVFLGPPRTEAAEHAEESGMVMVGPLLVLAGLSLVGGLMNIPEGFPLLGSIFGEHKLTSWLEESVTYAHAGSFEWLLAVIAVALAVGAIFLARSVYNDRALQRLERDPLELNEGTRGAFALANANLGWDAAYYKYIVFPYRRAAYWLADRLDWAFWHDYVHESVIYRNFQAITDWLTQPVDKGFIDRGFNSLGDLARNIAARARVIQSGYVRTYALSVLFGAILVMVIILFPVLRDLLGM